MDPMGNIYILLYILYYIYIISDRLIGEIYFNPFKRGCPNMSIRSTIEIPHGFGAAVVDHNLPRASRSTVGWSVAAKLLWVDTKMT